MVLPFTFFRMTVNSHAVDDNLLICDFLQLFSTTSEAFASEVVDNAEYIYPLYYMDGDIVGYEQMIA